MVSYLFAVGVGIICAAAIVEIMEVQRMCYPPPPRRKPRFYLVLPNSYKNPNIMSSAPMESDHATAEQKLEVNNLEDPTVYQTQVDRS